MILVEQRPSLLIRTCQHDFGAAAHTQRALVGVQRLRREQLALLEHELVEVGKHRRIEADRVFHQENHLHAHFFDVVLQIHFVLYQLDDRHEQVVVAQPAEHVLENAQVFVLHALADAVRKGREHHQRNVRMLFADGPRDVERVAIVRPRHTDYEVEHGIVELLPRFFQRGNLRESRRIAQAQVHVFVENLLVDAPVVLQHEGIIRVGHEQDVEYPLGHQIGELRILEVKLVEFYT